MKRQQLLWVVITAFLLSLLPVATFAQEQPNAVQPNLVKNGDFEAGRNGDWSERSNNTFGIVADATWLDPHSGQYAGWLGGVKHEKSRLFQSVTLPTSPKLFLSYYYRIGTSSQCGKDDKAKVFIDKSRVVEYSLCVGDKNSDWRQVTFDISAYGGKAVRLQFFAVTTGENHSDFWVEDVTITTTTNQEASAIQAPAGVEDEDVVFDAGAEGDHKETSQQLRNALYLPLVRQQIR